MTTSSFRLTSTERVDQTAGIAQLLEDAARVDGVFAVDESGRLGLELPQPGRTHLLVTDDGDTRADEAGDDHVPSAPTLVGYAHRTRLDDGEANGELVVHPRYRRRGAGHDLVAALLNADPTIPLRLWAHGDHPGAEALARTFAFTKVRELWRMSSHFAERVPVIEPSADVRVRPFVPGVDDRAWLELNAAAFANHPEQGHWSAEDLATRLSEPWFDPNGFFLAERAGQVVGFHWTKVHPNTAAGQTRVGEIYILGIHPDAHGQGLAKALASVGLRYLQDRGVPDVSLFVEADNIPAVRLYERFGFTHTGTDVMYRHAGASSGG